eukprot:scaffold123909_cov27-Prasinocladus_malaysianus.AAC.2
MTYFPRRLKPLLPFYLCFDAALNGYCKFISTPYSLLRLQFKAVRGKCAQKLAQIHAGSVMSQSLFHPFAIHSTPMITLWDA